MPSNHLVLCSPLLLLSSILPSIRVFSNELALAIRWPKYWSFTFSMSPSSEHSGLISFRIDWFDLAIQVILKRLLQHESLKASVLQHSALSVVPALTSIHDYWKNDSFDYTGFCWQSDSLLFNMLSRFFITFLSRKKKCFPIYLPWSDGTGCHDLSVLNIEF